MPVCVIILPGTVPPKTVSPKTVSERLDLSFGILPDGVKNTVAIPYERQEIIRRERELAKYANTMDSLFCIPFTKQGIGVDAILSLIPFVGDIAGLF